jgi:hypothetical protein
MGPLPGWVVGPSCLTGGRRWWLDGFGRFVGGPGRLVSGAAGLGDIGHQVMAWLGCLGAGGLLEVSPRGLVAGLAGTPWGV